MRISDISNAGLRKSPNKWTKEEDQKLATLVSIYGEKKWKKISAEMGGLKTGAQCAQHWKRVLSPDIRKGAWDENEEDLLFRLVTQHGSCWKKIAKKIARRTDIQCRYQYLKAKQSRDIKWSPLEDDALIRKVMEMEDKISWVDVADHMARLKHTSTLRTALECKERYEVRTRNSGTRTVLISNSKDDDCPSEILNFYKRPRLDKESKEFTDFRMPMPMSIDRITCKSSSVHNSHNYNETDYHQDNSGHKVDLWDCFASLESLAAVASVLPREMLNN